MARWLVGIDSASCLLRPPQFFVPLCPSPHHTALFACFRTLDKDQLRRLIVSRFARRKLDLKTVWVLNFRDKQFGRRTDRRIAGIAQFKRATCAIKVHAGWFASGATG